MVTLLNGLEGARVARTPAFDQLDEAGAFALPLRELIVVHGEHWAGKTVLTDTFLSRQSLPHTILELPPKPSSKDIVRWLHRSICGNDEARQLSERDLQDDLVIALAEPRIITVRHVQRLTAEATGQLEWLHSHQRTDFALLMEGGPGTGAVIKREAALLGRIAKTVHVARLETALLLPALHEMHDLFLGAETDLLVEIDNRALHGLLGNWARFLQAALHLRTTVAATGKPVPNFNRNFAKAILAALPTSTVRKRS
jgi:hypothetical protein